MPKARICVVNAGWPRLSTTFVAQELVGLEQLGLELWLATYGRSDDDVRQAIHARLQAPVHRLPMRPRASLRYLRAWLKMRGRPGYRRAVALLREQQARQKGKRPVRAFGRGLILAAEMPADVGLVYAHFLDAPTSAALYAATILELPLAASAHARDIWTASADDLAAKLKAMRWCATCTEPGAEYLRGLADDPAKVRLVYHGLDFARFPDAPAERPRRDGSEPADPVRLLSVGRAVEKKGFDGLLEALAALPPELAWEWHHIGSGPKLEPLRRRAEALGIASRIHWHGARDQASVIERYRDCDLFVLPSREAGDGDRDGLPNVLMEAQTQGLACLSTRFSAIPELIRDDDTGLLVEPGNTAALSAALERLIRSPNDRHRLGDAGCRRVREQFSAETGLRTLAGLIRATMA
jgi:glycosyltransferase involved in cell wall biosynthesis